MLQNNNVFLFLRKDNKSHHRITIMCTYIYGRTEQNRGVFYNITIVSYLGTLLTDD